MSGNLAQYGVMFETANGALLAQEQSITIDRTTNSQAVSTVPGGYVGESPGAPMVEINVENAVPQAGQEYDAGQAMQGLIPTQLYTLGPGGKQLQCDCMIYADSIRHSVNNPMQYSFRARGAFTLWK